MTVFKRGGLTVLTVTILLARLLHCSAHCDFRYTYFNGFVHHRNGHLHVESGKVATPTGNNDQHFTHSSLIKQKRRYLAFKKTCSGKIEMSAESGTFVLDAGTMKGFVDLTGCKDVRDSIEGLRATCNKAKYVFFIFGKSGQTSIEKPHVSGEMPFTIQVFADGANPVHYKLMEGAVYVPRGTGQNSFIRTRDIHSRTFLSIQKGKDKLDHFKISKIKEYPPNVVTAVDFSNCSLSTKGKQIVARCNDLKKAHTYIIIQPSATFEFDFEFNGKITKEYLKAGEVATPTGFEYPHFAPSSLLRHYLAFKKMNDGRLEMSVESETFTWDGKQEKGFIELTDCESVQSSKNRVDATCNGGKYVFFRNIFAAKLDGNTSKSVISETETETPDVSREMPFSFQVRADNGNPAEYKLKEGEVYVPSGTGKHSFVFSSKIGSRTFLSIDKSDDLELLQLKEYPSNVVSVVDFRDCSLSAHTRQKQIVAQCNSLKQPHTYTISEGSPPKFGFNFEFNGIKKTEYIKSGHVGTPTGSVHPHFTFSPSFKQERRYLAFKKLNNGQIAIFPVSDSFTLGTMGSEASLELTNCEDVQKLKESVKAICNGAEYIFFLPLDSKSKKSSRKSSNNSSDGLSDGKGRQSSTSSFENSGSFSDRKSRKSSANSSENSGSFSDRKSRKSSANSSENSWSSYERPRRSRKAKFFAIIDDMETSEHKLPQFGVYVPGGLSEEPFKFSRKFLSRKYISFYPQPQSILSDNLLSLKFSSLQEYPNDFISVIDFTQCISFTTHGKLLEVKCDHSYVFGSGV